MIAGFVGIDVSKATLDVLLLRANKRESQQFDNTPEGHEQLHKWIARRLTPNEVHVCLEATGCYSEAVAENLMERGYTVSVINPARRTAALGSFNAMTIASRSPIWIRAKRSACSRKRSGVSRIP